MPKDFEVTGVKALEDALRQFPTRFANKAIRQVFRDIMKSVVLPTYREKVPVQSATLKRAAKVRAAQGRRGKRLPRGLVGVGIRIINVRYASFVLLGTKYIEARRTLRNALFDNETRIKILVGTKLRRKFPQIAEEVRRAAKKKG